MNNEHISFATVSYSWKKCTRSYKSSKTFIIYVCVFCISDTFIAKENKDIRLVQQQTKHLCKCKYVE